MSKENLDPRIITIGIPFSQNFEAASKNAQSRTTEKQYCRFEFNGVECIVSPTTDLDLLQRDYHNSWTMGWKTIGHDCREYSAKTQDELDERKRMAKIEADEEAEERDQQEAKQRAEFEEKVSDIEMKISNSEIWKDYVEKNDDPYGKCCVDYAQSWAKLMQIEMDGGKKLSECASETSHELDFYGITGFMYGCAVNMLAECWEHGEELRKWHNKDYGHDGEGVVNPAILTLK